MEINEVLEELQGEDGIQEGNQNSIHIAGNKKNAAWLKKLREEKKRRERELLKRKNAQAVDLIGDNDVDVQNMKEISWFENLINQFLELIDEYKPFRKHLREVFVNYDRSICVFFQIV